MTEKEVRYYKQGYRSVYTEMIATATKGLGYKDVTLETMIVEREAVIVALRSLCEAFGSNEWDEHLSLSDVVNKHLARQLYDKYE